MCTGVRIGLILIPILNGARYCCVATFASVLSDV